MRGPITFLCTNPENGLVFLVLTKILKFIISPLLVPNDSKWLNLGETMNNFIDFELVKP